MGRRIRAFLIALLALGVPAGALQISQAAFHLIRITEVYPGSPSNPSAQFVELRIPSSTENQVGGQSLRVYNAAGNLVGTYTFGANAAGAAAGDKLLIATAAAQSEFGITPDLTMSSATIPASGGMVCWTTYDCMSWGTFAPGNGPGYPFSARDGLVLGSSAQRRGSPPVDTDNSSADFTFAAPTPQKFKGTAFSACCTVGFSAESYTVAESASSVTITVNRSPATGTLSVDYSTDNGSATGGEDYIAIPSTALNFADGQSTATFNVSILSDGPEKDETFLVKVRNASGFYFSMPDAIVTIDGSTPQSPLTAPTGLTAIAAGLSINLSWTAPPNNAENQLTGFEVWRGPTMNSETFLKTVGPFTTSTSDTIGTNSTTRCYKVKALNSVGASAFSNEACATTAGAAPSAPQNVQASTTAAGKVTITWSAPANPNGTITSYKIYMRGLGLDINAIALATTRTATVNGSTISYIDAHCTLGEICNYSVSAFNSSGESNKSSPEAAQPGSAIS
jgi:hypothetical protein